MLEFPSEALAHSRNESGEWHSFEDHISNVAALSREFGIEIGYPKAAEWQGWLHDLGKLSSEFQSKLRSGTFNYVPHKVLGALIALEKKWPDIAFTIAGHQGGIPCRACLRSTLEQDRNDSESLGWNNLLTQFLPQLEEVEIEAFPPRGEITTEIDLRIRLLFSCLVDADFLDTESHFSRERSEDRQMQHPSLDEHAGVLPR